MPNYTCVETITRQYFRPSVEQPRQSCKALAERKGTSYRLLPAATDRLRVDVSVTPTREWYSWAGASSFDSRDLSEIIGGGPIGTGAFGAFLMSIFGEKGGASFRYVGKAQTGGRTVMEFGYRMTKDNSGYRIRTSKGWVIAAYDGSLFANPETGDLLRLTVRTEELPLETGSCETSSQLDYRRVTIGEADFLLPLETRQRFVLRDGAESENTSTFSTCREYRGQSTVRFAGESEGSESSAGAGAGSTHWTGLPAGLRVTMELASPVDTWTASAGDVVAMRLAKPVTGTDGYILLAGGTAVEGRLIRVQRYYTSPPRATVVIEPEAIEIEGARVPFPVLPDAQRPAELIKTSGRSLTRYTAETALPSVTAFGVWSFTGSHVIVPKGYRTTWITAAEHR